MSRGRLKRIGALCCIFGAISAASAAAAALLEVNDLVIRADGAFEPRLLPKRQFAPISFEGHIDISAKSGGRPAALERIELGFDRDGRLSTGGLPTCAATEVAGASPGEARRLCANAIVGRGHVEASIDLSSGPVTASSPLTIFNGRAEAGHPTVVLHAQTTAPATQTFAIVVPIERRPGPFRYWATLRIPPIAGGHGSLTHIDIQVGRRFRAGGHQRSYVSAHCSDGVLETHGDLSFADGTIIEGAVQKFCRGR
jgi:hypothetical protein